MPPASTRSTRMFPTSVEVARSLHGSWRLMDDGEKALGALDISRDGFRKSYAAIILTVPAFVAVLAAQRVNNGQSNTAGLFSAPDIAVATLIQHVMSFLLLPALVMAMLWGIARTVRGTAFLISWNWAEVIVTMLLAVPAALYAIGFIPPTVAAMFTLAVAVIAARLRFAVARAALGLSVPTALGVMLLTFAVELSLGWALAVGRY
jgi:hypothetical protein